ncbi:MAG: hypothetical protein LBJ61_05520 [Deltaproteobacteria bacterium]|jgi:uncharacterized protein YecT (DUF1311 family)|nr:hypothetical protein [Deltaproteobacteria bacterium]
MRGYITLCIGALFLGLFMIAFSPALQSQAPRVKPTVFDDGSSGREKPSPFSHWDNVLNELAICDADESIKDMVSLSKCYDPIWQREDERQYAAFIAAMNGLDPERAHKLRRSQEAWLYFRASFRSMLLYPVAGAAWSTKEMANHAIDLEAIGSHIKP